MSLQQLDAALADAFRGWNVYSTAILAALLAFVAYIISTTADADTHPLLLARQAQASYVRQPRESPVYRAPETPHGYPLRSGLAVKPPGAPMYSAGRDGDLRDVWRRVVGDIPLDKKAASSGTATLMTVLGTEELSTHDLAGVSREMAVVGAHLRDHHARRVAVYLPNSLELLVVLFAAAFYRFTPILIPYNQPHAALVDLVQQANADALVAPAGSVPLADITRRVPALRRILWTVEKTSRHMGWSDVPEGIGGEVDVAVWHELVQDAKSDSHVLPADSDKTEKPPGVVFLWQEAVGKPAEIVEFTQQNLAAAVGALITALPAAQRFSPTDTFLPADAFTTPYCLCLTLAALFSHATLIINSVAGPGVDLALATRSLSPTIIVASPDSVANLHTTTAATATSPLARLALAIESRVLAAGRLPTDSLLTRLLPPTRAALGTSPSKLRLLFTSSRAGLNSPPLSSATLSALRIFTRARIVYALTAAKVAGAVAQTNPYDYRITRTHFGVPLSCLELKLKDTKDLKTTDDGAAGELVVKGNSVQGGEAALGIKVRMGEDHTLSYAE